MVRTKVELSAADRFSASFTSAQMDRLRVLFGGSSIKDAEELVTKLEQTQTIRIQRPEDEPVSVQMSTDDLWQLRQQSVGMSRDYQEYVKEFVEDCINLQLNGSYVLRSQF